MNVTQNDLMYFKNDILGYIKALENKQSERIEKLSSTLDSKFVPYENKINEINNKVFDLSNLISKDKSNHDKIEQLMSFKKRTEDTLTNQANMLSQCNRDLSNACYRYDKIFLDNFNIPGLIGNNCKFQSLKAYIENSIHQFTALNSFKDKQYLDLKSYKEKIKGNCNFSQNSDILYKRK